MGQIKLVQGQAGSFWHTKEINIDTNFDCWLTHTGHLPSIFLRTTDSFILQKKSFLVWQIYTTWANRFMLLMCIWENNSIRVCVWTNSSPVPIYLQVIWNEDFTSFLNHWLWFQLFFREFAFTRVKHLLARNAGKSKICRVRFIANGNLDGLRINRTWCVSVCWQDLTYNNKGRIQLR